MEQIYFFDFFSHDKAFFIHFESIIRMSIIVLALILDDILLIRRKRHISYDNIDSLVAVIISLLMAVFVTLPISLTPLSCSINLLGAGMMMSIFIKTFYILIKKYNLSFRDMKFGVFHFNNHRDMISPFIITVFFFICNAYLIVHLLRVIYIIEVYHIIEC